MSNILKEIDINITRDSSINSKINQKINTTNNHNKISNNKKSTNITVYKEDELLGMLYKDVVKVARSCGVKYNGKKVEIAKRIIQHQREQIIINKLNKINLNSNNNSENNSNNININNSNSVDYEEEEEILNTSLNNNYNDSSDEDELESYQIGSNHIDSISEDENEDSQDEESQDEDSQDEDSQDEDSQDEINIGAEDQENSSIYNQLLQNDQNESPLLEATPSYKIQITKSIMSVEKDSNGRLLVINRFDSDEESAKESEESAQDSEESAQYSDEESIDESNSTVYSTADEEEND